MNDYHVYEAIGRGKHSTVYKGRKKKTIEYFAIKSVDKSQRSKVHQEVKMLHCLDHPNVLKFHSWYETSAHLWLVLEYCVGGDLMTLLKQDSRLPEDSIHDLSRDLVKALQFLHSKGVIYCDLKPSNILLDENGCMKLCDFGLARRLIDIEKSSLPLLPQSKRGTPCYMAPELFQDGGVHSYASDFWALGCVLYECYAGKPPFTGNEFTKLVNSILLDPIPPLPDTPSKSLVNLIDSLLVKDPAERIQWPELCGHSFWRTKFTPVSLPPQPAFDTMLQLSSKAYLSERNIDRSSQQRTPPKRRENNANGVLKQNEKFSTGPKVLETPLKNVQSGRKVHTKSSGRVEDKHKATSNAVKVVNLLRLSRVAKLNLQREKEKENYRRPLPKTSENDTEVKIENNDMELDFSENPEDDAPDESESESENMACSPGEKVLVQHDEENIEEREHTMNQHENPFKNTNIMSDNIKNLEQHQCLEPIEVAATPPSANHQRKGSRLATPRTATDSEPSRSSDNIPEVFWHPTDLSVKPVMSSRKGDKTSDVTLLLPYYVPVLDYVKLSSEQLSTLNARIIHSLSGSSQVPEKQNAIKYIEMLSASADAANIIINGPVMLWLVKLLRQKGSTLRVQLVYAIGLLIRHSKVIEPELASSGIIKLLTDGLGDKQEKVRRLCMAALGELLFYIYTQNESSRKDNNPIESPSKDNRHTSGWQVPGTVITLVASILRKGEDDATQLYALKTVDNICSQRGDWTSRFACQDVIRNLCYIYKATGKHENTRLIAGSCLVRLARFYPASIQFVFEKLSFKDTASSVIKGSPREQQISLNLLNMAILSSHTIPNISRHLVSLIEEKYLAQGLLSQIEQGSEVLRGKTLIFVALLCKNSRRWLPHFLCNGKLLSAVDRLAKEKDAFIQQCMEAFVQLVTSIVPGVLETVSGDILQMMGGKRHGHIATLTGRNSSKSTAHLFPVVLHLLGSSAFKHRVVNTNVLLHLAHLVKLLETPFQGRDDFQITLLQVLETIIEEPSVILGNPKIFTSRVLPSLAILYNGNQDGDARFLCLKILFVVMVVIFNDTSGNSVTEDEQIKNDLKSISETYFLPLYPSFVDDDDPIPIYAQKLLLMLIEFNYIKVSDILQLKTVSQCFEFLLSDLSNANVNDVKLCLALVSAPEMDSKVLSHLQVIRKIGNMLEFVTAKGMEDFLEPTLGLCKAFILRSIGSCNGMAISKEPSILGTAAFDMSMDVDQHYYVKDISEFSSNIGALLDLVGNPEAHIADLASECVVLLLKATPREATTGLLTNLSKLSSLLDTLHHGDSALLLLRLLNALSYSCRLYLSQAMILSISTADVKRVDVLVSDLKSSSLPGVSEAALSLGSELQRLPCCI